MSLPIKYEGTEAGLPNETIKLANLVQDIMQRFPGVGAFQEAGTLQPIHDPSTGYAADPTAGVYVQDAGPLPGGSKRCNCKKAKCLKLYCVCFSAGVYCSGCPCKDCLNTQAHNDIVMLERQKVLQRSPYAFAPKVEQRSTGDISHKKGCKCRKSRCLKKYCECYDAGVLCSSICRCDDCHNQSDDVPMPIRSSRRRDGQGAPGSPSHPSTSGNEDQAGMDVEADTAVAFEAAHAATPILQDMMLLADFKPTDSLPCSGSLPNVMFAPGSVPNSLIPSPLAAAGFSTNPLAPLSHATADANIGAIPHPHTAPTPADGNNLSSFQPTPFLNNAAAASNGTQVPPHMLLKPEFLISEPEYAQILAANLGLDRTHQVAAQKAAQILRQLIHTAKDHPTFAGYGPFVSNIWAGTAERTAGGVAPTPTAHTTSAGGIVMLQSLATARPPPTATPSAGMPNTSDQAAPRPSGSLRFGSGSYRITGSIPQRLSSDGCKPTSSGQGPEGSLQRHASTPVTGLGAMGVMPLDTNGQQVLMGGLASLRRVSSMPSPANSYGSDGGRLAAATSNGKPPSGRGVKRARSQISEECDDGAVTNGTNHIEVSSGSDKAMLANALNAIVNSSPMSKSMMSVGRARRGTPPASCRPSPTSAKGRKGAADKFDSANEIEALQALFDLKTGA